MKDASPAKQEQLAPAPADSSDLTIEEWAKRKSITDKRVELLGAFYTMTKKQTPKASTAAFDAAYETFAKQPA